ncbi:MAG TPA: hypothetical protein VNL77_20720 [Roseiflexaceae bacterium]|nr:hypothetical protein [Roseiflexaceae bacterium]
MALAHFFGFAFAHVAVPLHAAHPPMYASGTEQALLNIPLKRGASVIGGALTPDRLYVAIDDGVLYAIQGSARR